MAKKEIIRVCDWCRKAVDADAPALQTTSVDYAEVVGAGARPAVSKVRSYHTMKPDCYKQMLTQQRLGATAIQPVRSEPMSKEAVSQDAFHWSDAFDMSAEGGVERHASALLQRKEREGDPNRETGACRKEVIIGFNSDRKEDQCRN